MVEDRAQQGGRMDKREEMSSWMDGEMESNLTEPMSDHVLASEQARQDWNCWHLIGDVMRSASVTRPTSVANRVADALAHEPLHFPRATAVARTTRKPRLAYGAAVAAAVAFVAYMALAPQMQEGTMMAGAPGTVTTASAPATASVERLTPVALNDPRVRDLIDAHGSMSIRPVSAEVR